MILINEKYVNPFTDFGFKKLFGEEPNKDLLIDFLNSLIPDQKITKLTYNRVDRLGLTTENRKVIFDLFCERISRVMSTFSRRVSSGTSAGSGSKDLQAFSMSCCKSETGNPNLK